MKFKTSLRFRYWLLAVYLKMQRKRRNPGPGPEPEDWTPIQQVPGWTVSNASGAGIDNGTSFAKENHAITGLDNSLYLLALNAQASTMPAEGFPMRITVIKWDDTIAVAGVDKILDNSIQAPGLNVTKGEPPSTGFPGSPFEFTCVPSNSGDGQEASTQIGVMFIPPLLSAGNPTVTLSFTMEVETEPGVWEHVNDTDGTVTDDNVNLTYDPGTKTFNAVDYNLTLSYFGIRYTLHAEQRLTLNCRITVVTYDITPDPGIDPGDVTVTKTTELSFYNGGDPESGTKFLATGTYPDWVFAGSPYTVDQETTNFPYVPPTSYNFDIYAFECAFQNSDLTGQVVDFDISIEVQLP